MDRQRRLSPLQVLSSMCCTRTVHTMHHRVVPRERYLTSVRRHGVGLTQSCMAMQSWGDVCAAGSGLSVVGEVCPGTLCTLCTQHHRFASSPTMPR